MFIINMNLYNEKKIYNGKTYNTLYVEFDNGFCLPVKPLFELSKKQYSCYMHNLETLPEYLNDFVKEVSDLSVDSSTNFGNSKKVGDK